MKGDDGKGYLKGDGKAEGDYGKGEGDYGKGQDSMGIATSVENMVTA